MGQAKRGLPQASALIEGDAAPIGAYLARQRRLRGISLDELAEETRIPRRSLERLEAGAFDASPDGFVRGFVRTVSGALGLEPDQAVARMLPEPSVEARHPSRRLARAVRGPLGWLGLAALLISALGLWVASLRTPSALPSHPAEAELVHRRDAVRELAESMELLPPPDAEAAAAGLR